MCGAPRVPWQDNQKRFLEDLDVKRRYLEYRRCTSPLLPMPPALYAALPLWVKRWVSYSLRPPAYYLLITPTIDKN